MVETSGSMRSGSMDSANSAVQRVIGFLKQRQVKSEDVQLEIGVLGFSSSAQWAIRFPVPVSKVQQGVPLNAKGGTNLSSALSFLNDALAGASLLASTPSDYPIVLAVIVDGAPSDIGLYKDSLEVLRRNQWYRNSFKLGFALGDGAASIECIEVLGNVVGSPDRVFKIPSASRLPVALEKEISHAVSAICSNEMLDNVSDISGTEARSTTVPPPSSEQTNTSQMTDTELNSNWIYELVF